MIDNISQTVGLKSDHFGIETHYSKKSTSGTKILKSDHFGIETLKSLCICVRDYKTKIRPFWD